MKQTLLITYTDGSNPFAMIYVDEKIIKKEIAFQKKVNKDIIGHIYITSSQEKE